MGNRKGIGNKIETIEMQIIPPQNIYENLSSCLVYLLSKFFILHFLFFFSFCFK